MQHVDALSGTGSRVWSPACVNSGGPRSVIRLTSVPALEKEAILAPEAAEALRRWRARPGEILTLVDPEENCYRARVTQIDPDQCKAIPFFALPTPSESSIRIELFQALPAKERFELILQKSTELGVSRIVPFTSCRSSTLVERDSGQKKSHRWPDVILRAARQCRRAMIPELYPTLDWEQAVTMASRSELKLILFEGAAPCSLREVLGKRQGGSVSLLVGPEGGFDSAEMVAARRYGILPVSLGPRILRTETAAIIGAAMVQFVLGDLG